MVYPIALNRLDSLAIALSLFFLTIAHASSLFEPSETDPPEVSTQSTFLERYYHASIILGDYLYIDGGMVAFRHNDSTLDYQPENNTYSIDMTKPWTNQTVVLTQIPKTAPVVNGEVLWADDKGRTFYAWGGSLPGQYLSDDDYQDEIPSNSVWQFSPNGAIGSWSEVPPAPNSGLDGLLRPSYGSGTFGNGVGYEYGGYIDQNDDAQIVNDSSLYPSPGLISYNFKENTWSNTSVSVEGNGSRRYNQMEFVPIFGSAGLVLAFGGGTFGITEEDDDLSTTPLSLLSSIDIFDPPSGKWYTQSTSGPTPAPRAEFCSVGVAGDNGTFEIFIHGGQKFDEDNLSLDEIFVLSLPAFTWQQAPYAAAHPRAAHTCNVRQGQMIIVGGYVADRSNTTDYYPADPWPLGLGVFDMTNLVFQDHYDPNAPNYTTPQVLKNYYQANGMYPSSWNDPDLATLFQSTNSSGPGPEPEIEGGTSSSHTGAIAGGVVGGVVGLALIGVLIWWLLRRRKSPKYQQAQVTDSYQPGIGPDIRPSEKAYNEQAALDQVRKSPAVSSPGMSSLGMQSPEMNSQGFGAQQPYNEIHAHDIRHEVDGQAVRQGGERPHELQ